MLTLRPSNIDTKIKRSSKEAVLSFYKLIALVSLCWFKNKARMIAAAAKAAEAAAVAAKKKAEKEEMAKASTEEKVHGWLR